jgi:hypothetical protein
VNGVCVYFYHGKDDDGTLMFECRTHGCIELSPDAPCNGYIEIPYNVGLQKREPVPTEGEITDARLAQEDVPLFDDHGNLNEAGVFYVLDVRRLARLEGVK